MNYVPQNSIHVNGKFALVTLPLWPSPSTPSLAGRHLDAATFAQKDQEERQAFYFPVQETKTNYQDPIRGR